MSYDRIDILALWLRRLLLLTLLAVAVLIALGVWRGDLTARRTLQALGQLTRIGGTPRPEVALIAGHRGYDTGAMCEDGVMEVAITDAVATLAAERLRKEGIDVRVLDEYDKSLNGLSAAALVSIHVDSCIPMSGFKVASATKTIIPAADARLVACIKDRYAAATGLSEHPTTITTDMTEYHAFQRVTDDTPGAIVELGFLGGDAAFLQSGQEAMAQGIAGGIVCFLEARRDNDGFGVPIVAPTATVAPD